MDHYFVAMGMFEEKDGINFEGNKQYKHIMDNRKVYNLVRDCYFVFQDRLPQSLINPLSNIPIGTTLCLYKYPEIARNRLNKYPMCEFQETYSSK